MKFKHIMMTLLFSLTVSGCQNVNGILVFSLNNDNNSYSVTCRFDVDPISIEIPSTHLEKPVTSIADYAFSDCQSLTSIMIPDGVTSIGDRAFNDCSSLTSINVSDDNDNYSSIDGVFYDKNKTTLINYPCGKLETIFVIPDSVTSIGIYAFFNCTSLTTIDIPASVTSICEGAFYNCNALASIMIPDGVTSISEKAFYDCSALTTIVISDTTTSIGDSAFFRCSSLTLIVIPLSVTSIGSAAFSGCSSLTIYAEASAKPSGWKDNWNSNYRPVVWGYTG